MANARYQQLLAKLFDGDSADTTQDNVLKGLETASATSLSAELSTLRSELDILLKSDTRVQALEIRPDRREKFLALIAEIEKIHKRAMQAIHRHASGVDEEQNKLYTRVSRFDNQNTTAWVQTAHNPRLLASFNQMRDERRKASQDYTANQSKFADEPGLFLTHLKSQISLLEREKQFIEQVKNSYLDLCQRQGNNPDDAFIRDYQQHIDAIDHDITELTQQEKGLTARYQHEYDYIVELKNQLTDAYIHAFDPNDPTKQAAANTLEGGFFTGVNPRSRAQAIKKAQQAGIYASTMDDVEVRVGNTTALMNDVPANRPEQYYDIPRLARNFFCSILPFVSAWGHGSELTYTMDGDRLTGFISFHPIEEYEDAIGFAKDLKTLLTNMYEIAPPKNGYDFKMPNANNKGIRDILAGSRYFSKKPGSAVDVFLIEEVIKPFLLATPPEKNPCMVFKGVDRTLLKEAHREVMKKRRYTDVQIEEALQDVDYTAEKDSAQHPAYSTENPIPPAPASTPNKSPTSTAPRDALLGAGGTPGQQGGGGGPTPPSSPTPRNGGPGFGG